MPHGENYSFGVPIVTKEVFNFLDAVVPTLKVESWSDAARTIQIRGFTRHGFISHDHTTNSDRSVATDSFRIPDFPLEVRASSSSSGIRAGQCFVKVTLQMGGLDVATIIAGYVTDEESPCYPIMIPHKSTMGPGKIRHVVGTDQVAGSEFSETVPTNARWLLLGVSVVLVNAVVAATRQPSLIIDDGANISLRSVATSGSTSGQTKRYSWGSYGQNAQLAGACEVIMVPCDLYLEGGYRIRSDTNGLQGGDDYAAPVLHVVEWIEE